MGSIGANADVFRNGLRAIWCLSGVRDLLRSGPDGREEERSGRDKLSLPLSLLLYTRQHHLSSSATVVARVALHMMYVQGQSSQPPTCHDIPYIGPRHNHDMPRRFGIPASPC